MAKLQIACLIILCTYVGCAQKIQLPDRHIIYVKASSQITDPDGSDYAPFQTLEQALAAANSGDEIYLFPGRYEAIPEPYSEALCGNCEVHQTPVLATSGFHIKDKALIIIGMHRDSVFLITNAGYGLFFENSPGSEVSNITITGGRRDPDGNATDAAVVAKYSFLTVKNCRIMDNDHRLDSVIVGIGGVFGRENSRIIVTNNLIQNNGWDGVALYRGASAIICDNVIDRGRGAGIGITWDSRAIVMRNRISNYWKGIGTFGNSVASVSNNMVFDNLGWGIIASGFALMEVRNNVIVRNGNCGFAAWSEDTRGYLKNNIIAFNGWKEEWVCPCVGVWMNGKLPNFPVSYNDVFENLAGNYLGMPDWVDKYGNLSANPQFLDSLDFHLDSASLVRNAGDPYYTNPDGSRSDMGAYGGPDAIR